MFIWFYFDERSDAYDNSFKLFDCLLQSSAQAQAPAKLGWVAIFSANPTTHTPTRESLFLSRS